MGAAQWTTTNHFEDLSEQDHALNLMGWKGVVLYELLPRNRTINSDVHGSQLNKLHTAIHEKHPELVNRRSVVFHHDNAKSAYIFTNPAKIIGARLECPHPPYFPNITPSNYHLFRSPPQIPWMESTSFVRKLSNDTWNNFYRGKQELLWMRNYEAARKMANKEWHPTKLRA